LDLGTLEVEPAVELGTFCGEGSEDFGAPVCPNPVKSKRSSAWSSSWEGIVGAGRIVLTDAELSEEVAWVAFFLAREAGMCVGA
jgi:hypothetical protein